MVPLRPPGGAGMHTTESHLPDRGDMDERAARRIHTCFLEQLPEHITVHGVIHELGTDGWSMKVSSYEKLQLAPAVVIRRRSRRPALSILDRAARYADDSGPCLIRFAAELKIFRPAAIDRG